MKQNLKNEDARKAILAGMAEVADIVGATLGPRGQTVILDRPFGAPLVTKDGVTVAKQIAVPDVFENAGAKLIQEVAQKTNMEAGDGTTAATILTHAIFREGVKVVAAGANSMAIERGIHRAVATVVAQLAVLAQPIAKDQIDAIRHIATIAANGDKEMGDVIARAVHRTGIEGVCRVDTSPTIETTVDFTEGLQFERGLLAPYFMTDPGRGVAIHENCNIFVTDRRMIDQKQMAAFLELYGQIAGRAPLLIVAEDIAEGALQVLAVNSPPARASKNLPQIAPICPVRCPGSGATKKEEIEDIAIFCRRPRLHPQYRRPRRRPHRHDRDGQGDDGHRRGAGEGRALMAAENAIQNPLLDEVTLKGAKAVLVNITGGLDMTLLEVDEAANAISAQVDPEANIIFGAASIRRSATPCASPSSPPAWTGPRSRRSSRRRAAPRAAPSRR